jgi:hypothetical protein
MTPICEDLKELADSSSPGTLIIGMLRKALSIHEIDDQSWLSSSIIDIIMSTFAKEYNSSVFMSVDFAAISLSSHTRSDKDKILDIKGECLRKDALQQRPILLICNAQNIHWNLIRIVFKPHPEIQLFEPIGKPTNRRQGLNFRAIPRQVIEWLDIWCTLPSGESWITLGKSVVTRQQQFTPYDCGVACLLYAEKCAQGMVRGQHIEILNVNMSSHENCKCFRISDISHPKCIRLSLITFC